MPTLEQRYKVMGYCDDLKPAICKRNEFNLIDKAVTMFENASGCLLDRNQKSIKCKLLLLSEWKSGKK